MAWASFAIPAAATLIGGMMSSDAAGDAAGIGAAAADRASGVNKYIFDKQVELQQPFRQTGLLANNRLAYLLGLSSPSTSGALTQEEIRNSLLPRFTTQETQKIWQPNLNYDNDDPFSPKTLYVDVGSTKIDEAGLSKEIARIMEEQGRQPTTANDADFGSLLKTFDASKMYEDPGYQFRLTEGMKGVENSAAARGNLLSGAALKAIQKYGQDYASNEYGNAYNRFNADKTNKYNMLAGVVNTGLGATNVLTDASQKLGASTASNILDAGNARAAGAVGSANAWNTALGQGYNAWQGNNILQNQTAYQNRLLDLIRSPGSTAYSNSGGWGTGYAYGNQDYGQNF